MLQLIRQFQNRGGAAGIIIGAVPDTADSATHHVAKLSPAQMIVVRADDDPFIGGRSGAGQAGHHVTDFNVRAIHGHITGDFQLRQIGRMRFC